MRVLLIWPDSRNEVLGWGDLGAIAEPLALEYLGAAVELDGHDARILDLRLHPDDLDATVSEFEPDLVGVTAFSMHVRRALAICSRVKQLRPRCRTVVGGHHATFLPEDFFAPQIDYVVAGNGIDAIRALARAGSGEAPPVPNLWRLRDGVHSLDLSGSSLDGALDSMPMPARHLTAADRKSYFIDWMQPVALVRTTLGCPYRCSFCSIWKAAEGRYYVREIETVVEELGLIEEPWVFLIDDEAFINGKRMKRLARAIAAAGIQKQYFTYCRIDTLIRNEDAVLAWREIGLERLFVGIDAISPKDLREYNKGCTLTDIEEGLAVADRLGISVFAQFVVNTDFSLDDFKRLTRFIEHHRIRYPSFTVLTPLPGTDMLKTFDAVTELQPGGRPNWDLFDCQNAVTLTALSKRDFRQQYRGLYHVFKGSYAQYRDHNYFVDDRETPLLGGSVVMDM